MSVFSWLFGRAVAARNAMYDKGWRKSGVLRHAVVSVGNLSVGGTGKTPFLIALGELLQKRGVAFDVLTRGYGRADSKIRLVEENGSAELYGDEPLLLAQKLHVPVFVGPDRFVAGKHAEEMFADAKPAHGVWLHLLDDGFQHRKLARDYDIVLVGKDDAQDELLPSGRLREPLSALSRADAVVLTDGAITEGLPLTTQQVWTIKRQIRRQGAKDAKQPIAVCGIARPERFLNDLQAASIELAGKLIFNDHHTFSATDVRSIIELAKAKQADAILTTEKDAVRLAPFKKELENVAPLIAVPLVMELENADAALDAMMKTIESRRQSRATSF